MRLLLFTRALSSNAVSNSMLKQRTNKFINDARNAVDDSIRGLLYANPGCATLDSCQRVVLRSDIEEVRKSKRVTLLAGGGSGHEPYAAGFVGKGLISAAVCGNVFASPPTAHISAALSSIKSASGTAVYIINYTGDRLNFGLAVERYNGIKRNEDGIAEAVVIGDDVALEGSGVDESVGRRGLAGAVLLLKIAGAMAEDGSDLQSIVFASRTVNENMGTFGVSLSACSIPGKGPMFQLGENEMEFGLGIHGEAGCERSDYLTARKVAELLVSKLEKSGKLKLHKGERIVVLLNNLGGTSQLELNILSGEILSEMYEKGYDVERFYADAVMTSLDGHGVSVTVLKVVDDDWLRCLDMETEALSWKYVHQLQKRSTRLTKIKCPSVETEADARTGVTLAKEEEECLKAAVKSACNAVISATEELNRLDGTAGDGDCGSTLKIGAEMLLRKLNEGKLCCDRPQTLFNQISHIFEGDVGGTAGALYALMFSSAAQAFSHSATSKDWHSALRNGLQAIMTYGRAKPGYRSMVDPLNAAASAVTSKCPNKADWETAVQKAAEAAKATSMMRAQVGRASYTAVAAQNEPDAGATAVAIWMRAIYDAEYP